MIICQNEVRKNEAISYKTLNQSILLTYYSTVQVIEISKLRNSLKNIQVEAPRIKCLVFNHLSVNSEETFSSFSIVLFTLFIWLKVLFQNIVIHTYFTRSYENVVIKTIFDSVSIPGR